MIKVVCWNIDGGIEPWNVLVKMKERNEADVALLQEAGPVPADLKGKRLEVDDTMFDDPKAFKTLPLVIKLSDRVKVEPYRQVSVLSHLPEDAIGVSDIGTIAAAKVVPVGKSDEAFIAVSMYARWLRSHPHSHADWIVSVNSAHRIISDLTTFIAGHKTKHRILAAGDLTMFFGAVGKKLAVPVWERTVWDRMQALGMVFMGPQQPCGRPPEPGVVPIDVPPDTKPEDYPGPPHRTTPRRTTEKAAVDQTQSNMADPRDRCRGTMVGLAVGNLLGIRFEGKPRWLVDQQRPEGVREIEASPGYPDDDDLAQAVILAAASMTSETLDVEDLARRFWVWGEENGLGMGSLTRKVLTRFGGSPPQRVARYWVQFGEARTGGAKPVPRQPEGSTALDAARQVWEEAGRKAAGNGAVMRCAPLAIRWMYDETELVRNTVASAVATHYDPRCVWSSIAVNLAIATLLKGVAVDVSDLIPRGRSAMERIGAALAPFGSSETPWMLRKRYWTPSVPPLVLISAR